mmetsp:Transcript_24451/g.35059  ORF Transcript_24451/g.35059 Transcript_24451/m.35059 type:complete len:292 (+) Transcript_24451:45-920(+)
MNTKPSQTVMMSATSSAVEGAKIDALALKEAAAIFSHVLSEKLNNPEVAKQANNVLDDKSISTSGRVMKDPSETLLTSIGTTNAFMKQKDSEKNTMDRKVKKKNELTKLIPGYQAPMKLEAQGLPTFATTELLKLSDTTQLSTASQALKMTKHRVENPYVGSSFKLGIKKSADLTAGHGWFHMQPTEKTDEVKTDLAVIRMRNILDPKRFYKTIDKTSGKGVIQIGTVMEGTGEFWSSRLTKKQRRSNLTEELMADGTVASYTKNKYREIQQANEAKFARNRPRKIRKKGL